MDLQQAYYELQFENLFLKSKGNTFQEFFEKWHDPELGEKIAQSFREKYQILEKQGLTPNKIFSELQIICRW